MGLYESEILKELRTTNILLESILEKNVEAMEYIQTRDRENLSYNINMMKTQLSSSLAAQSQGVTCKV